MTRGGDVSVGGSARFARVADGWVVLNLPRPSDVAALPALVEASVEPDDWPAVKAMGMRRRLGIAGSILDQLGLDSTSGYLIFEGLDSDNAPQIAARTYTSDENGGTYGLHLPAFGPRDVLKIDELEVQLGVRLDVKVGSATTTSITPSCFLHGTKM